MIALKTDSLAKTRVPEPANGIQVNFCKNPTCLNYGRPASDRPQPRGPGAKDREGRDTYTIGGSSEYSSTMTCLLCGEHPPVKSNRAVAEELERMSSYLQLSGEQSCPISSCPNHQIPIGTPKTYLKSGFTKGGSQRYRCLSCKTTFSVATSTTRWQRKPEVNEQVFTLLVNKMPLKRIGDLRDFILSTKP